MDGERATVVEGDDLVVGVPGVPRLRGEEDVRESELGARRARVDVHAIEVTRNKAVVAGVPVHRVLVRVDRDRRNAGRRELPNRGSGAGGRSAARDVGGRRDVANRYQWLDGADVAVEEPGRTRVRDHRREEEESRRSARVRPIRDQRSGNAGVQLGLRGGFSVAAETGGGHHQSGGQQRSSCPEYGLGRVASVHADPARYGRGRWGGRRAGGERLQREIRRNGAGPDIVAATDRWIVRDGGWGPSMRRGLEKVCARG